MIWYKLNLLLKTSSYFYILHVFKEPSTLLHLIGQVNPGWSYPGCQRLFFSSLTPDSSTKTQGQVSRPWTLSRTIRTVVTF